MAAPTSSTGSVTVRTLNATIARLWNKLKSPCLMKSETSSVGDGNTPVYFNSEGFPNTIPYDSQYPAYLTMAVLTAREAVRAGIADSAGSADSLAPKSEYNGYSDLSFSGVSLADFKGNGTSSLYAKLFTSNTSRTVRGVARLTGIGSDVGDDLGITSYSMVTWWQTRDQRYAIVFPECFHVGDDSQPLWICFTSNGIIKTWRYQPKLAMTTVSGETVFDIKTVGSLFANKLGADGVGIGLYIDANGRIRSLYSPDMDYGFVCLGSVITYDTGKSHVWLDVSCTTDLYSKGARLIIEFGSTTNGSVTATYANFGSQKWGVKYKLVSEVGNKRTYRIYVVDTLTLAGNKTRRCMYSVAAYGTWEDFGDTGRSSGTPVEGCVDFTAMEVVATSCSGNAATATAWATTRKFRIVDNANTNQGPQVNVNGGGDVSIQLPATIAADISGKASGLSAQSMLADATYKVPVMSDQGDVRNGSALTYAVNTNTMSVNISGNAATATSAQSITGKTIVVGKYAGAANTIYLD